MKDKLSTNDLYEIIIDNQSLVWSSKSGIAKSGWRVIVPRTERLHRVRNFTLHRIEEFFKYHRSTLSDFEYDYYLSASFIAPDVICLDVCRVFDLQAAAEAYAKGRDGYVVEKF